MIADAIFTDVDLASLQCRDGVIYWISPPPSSVSHG